MSKKNQNQSPKEPNFRLRRTIAAGTAIAGLIGGGLALNNKMDDSARNHYDKIEAEAIKEAKTGWNSVVVLHEGATYRTSPHTVNSDGESGPDTVAGTVASGEVLRIDRPIAFVEQGPDQHYDTYWFGFTLNSEVADSTDRENVYWVNFSELQRQSNADNSYVEVYDYQSEGNAVDNNHSQPQYNYNVGTDDNGNFVSDLVRKGGPVATASVLPENIFDQMVINEHLSLAHGK